MEVTDLVYLFLVDMVNNLEYDRSLHVVYGYNVKGINLWQGDWIIVYNRGQNTDWLGLSGANWMGIENVSVDVYTLSKKNYALLKRKIWEIFNGMSYTFKFNGNAYVLLNGYDYEVYEYIGTNIIRLKLIEDVSGLRRGDLVVMIDQDNVNDFKIIDVGFVWGIYNGYLYLMRYQSVFCLIRPTRIQDMSLELKKQYRFTMDIEGRIITSVGDYDIELEIDYEEILDVLIGSMKDYIIAEKYEASTLIIQSVELQVDGYGLIEVTGSADVDGTFNIYMSDDGKNWWTIHSETNRMISLTFPTGKTFVKLEFVPSAASDGKVDLIIAAKR